MYSMMRLQLAQNAVKTVLVTPAEEEDEGGDHVTTGEDTRIRFSLDPNPGETAFEQWRDAMRAVARLPCGIPDEFRHKVWRNLAKHHIHALRLDWASTVRFAFNDRANPDDSKLDLQIVKDLHRTGSTGFSGQENEEDRAVLKRVLLAFARWNKQVGYCQGFNVIAALLLEVTGRCETGALQLMIYLVDHVLPDGYFNPQLRALSVDMAVFRELLRQARPRLARHLDKLQQEAACPEKGGGYEPPLLNVFSMQWLVTLYATCLPKPAVLRLWDAVLLEGSEVLLRAGIALWTKLQRRVLKVSSADEFYSRMSGLCQELVSGELITTEELMKAVYGMGPFPLPQLAELRERYAYNITPFSGAMGNNNSAKVGKDAERGSRSSQQYLDDLGGVGCFSAVIPGLTTPGPADSKEDSGHGPDSARQRHRQPSLWPTGDHVMSFSDLERTSTDLCALGLQYRKLQQRQQQARIIINNAFAKHNLSSGPLPEAAHVCSSSAPLLPSNSSPAAVNHLMLSAKYGRLAAQKRRTSSAGGADTLPAPSPQAQVKALAVITKTLELNSRELGAEPSTTPAEHSAFSPVNLTPISSPRRSPRHSDASDESQSSPASSGVGSIGSGGSSGLPVRSPELIKVFNPFPTRGQSRRRGGQLDLYKGH